VKCKNEIDCMQWNEVNSKCSRTVLLWLIIIMNLFREKRL